MTNWKCEHCVFMIETDAEELYEQGIGCMRHQNWRNAKNRRTHCGGPANGGHGSGR